MSSIMDYGTTKAYNIPIDHLDFKFIETCTDVKHLEKILSILRFPLAERWPWEPTKKWPPFTNPVWLGP